MKIWRKGEKGFTMIELLIVVAILGVLAAVVIPNVGRFIGRGEDEAAATELSNVQTAVISMMVDNGLSTLPHPVAVGDATSDMTIFPDADSACATVNEKVYDPSGTAYTVSADKDGFILYGHDIIADSAATSLVNYTATDTTKGTYWVEASGTVHQATTGYE